MTMFFPVLVGFLKIIIGESSDSEEYVSAWGKAMQGLYWYQSDPVFDFNRDEETADIKATLGKENNTFLIAREKKSGEDVGVMDFTLRNGVAVIRRWEPGVQDSLRSTSVGGELFKEAMKQAKKQGAKRMRVLVKHPHDRPEVAEWHLRLYQEFKLRQTGKTSVDLTMALKKPLRPVAPKMDYEVVTGERLASHELAHYIVRAYSSTPEDLKMFEYDSSLTDREQANQFVERVLSGSFGPAPNEFRRVLLMNGEPTGFVGAFAIESPFKPLTGVLGPVGVFPEFRRQGIARFLVEQTLEALRMFGCEYAAVGTEEANVKAIRLYEKVGFRLACKLRWFEAKL
jgi:GNAT superfamily N-acetyltransferase